MSDAALHGLALLIAIAGMTACSLSIQAHWRQATGRQPAGRSARYGLRALGATLLAAAFAVCARADPASMAILCGPCC